MNASVTEQDRVNGIQNPMFGIVKTRYLTGFEKEEVRTLISVFGKRMGMRFDESSLDALFERYGGHPLLTRMICSQINNGLKVSGVTRPVAVTSETVAHDLQSREDEVQFYCGHITSELEEFYPEEFFMLETLASGNITDFNELASEIDYTRHLKAYGLVDFSRPYIPEFRIPIIKGFIASKWRRRNGYSSTRYIVPLRRRPEFISGRAASILREMRLADKRFTSLSLPRLYSGSGPSEAELFAGAAVCESRDELVSFLNQSNRSLIEPIDKTGDALCKRNYFFTDLKSAYPRLWPALNRVRAYRNQFLHLDLTPLAHQQYTAFLQLDLDGRSPEDIPDGWFQLQSAVLNGLLIGLQAEMAVYD